MEILNAKLHHSDGYCNSPTLQVLVDKLPDNDDFVFEERNHLYMAELDGYVRYHFYQKPGDGYGGRVFKTKVLRDGNVVEEDHIGPWSSRAGCVNKLFGDKLQCVDVSITDDPKVFERGHTFYAGAITLPMAIKACRKIQGCELVMTTTKDGENISDDITYETVKIYYDNRKNYRFMDVRNTKLYGKFGEEFVS